MNITMIPAARWLPAALVALIAGCASMSVSTERHPQADFAAYRGYAWISADPLIRPPGEQPQVSALTVRFIREAIEKQLHARGYRQVEVPAPTDFVVAFTVGTRDRIDTQSYPVTYRGPWDWEGHASETGLRVFQEGTLSIDIFDGASHQPVWHGRASKVITSSDVADPGPVIDKAVAAILEKFPPR
jgi:hypothetical protein